MTHAVFAVPPKGMHIALWILQLVVAAVFALSGFAKLTTPIAQLAESVPWAADAQQLARFVGAAELAGAMGLVLPAGTRILPFLTPLAAALLGVVMVLALGFHLYRAEYGATPTNLVLLGLCASIAWGRTRKAPVSPR